jgi:hypothetical protein
MVFTCENAGYSHARGYFDLLLLFLLFSPGRFGRGRNIVCSVMRLNAEGGCVHNTGDITTRMIWFSVPEQRATGRFFHQAATTRTVTGYSFFVTLCHAASPFIIMVRRLLYRTKRDGKTAKLHDTPHAANLAKGHADITKCFVPCTPTIIHNRNGAATPTAGASSSFALTG